MHPLMIEEAIRTREEEASYVADQNRLVAIALEGQPGLTDNLVALLEGIYSKAAVWVRALGERFPPEAVES